LQGFPDYWTDINEVLYDRYGKPRPWQASDTARYKAIGNSVAIPCVEFIMRRIVEVIGLPLTLGSLFDGIAGFPLSAQRVGIKSLWASEIEPFCMKVTQRHF
jgi:site-specific DNA-cytosine methylase